MAGFYHFLPGLTKERLDKSGRLDREVLSSRGLDEVLADVEIIGQQVILADVQKGPSDGKAGVLLYPRPPEAEGEPFIGFDPGRQTWYQGTQRAIGWLTEAPPGPEDLARIKQFPGYYVKDEHGRQWSVPIIRSPHNPLGSLPRDITFDAQGKLTPRLKPRYLKLWEEIGLLWDVLNGTPRDEPAAHDPEWMARQAVAGLSVNYRVGLHEVTALYEAGLSLLDDGTVHNICVAMVDIQALQRAEKKTSGSAIAAT